MGDNGEESSEDLYAVLGLKKECTASELRSAYKKLALRWHPDRCSVSRNSNFADEATSKFQEIQQAYSVLSDENKRFLYDVGAYEDEDDEVNGMGDFMNELAVLMNQSKAKDSNPGSLKDLQELFDEMFQCDDMFFGSQMLGSTTISTSASSSLSYVGYHDSSTLSGKRCFSAVSGGKEKSSFGFDSYWESFGPEIKRHRKEDWLKGDEVKEETHCAERHVEETEGFTWS